ncbi:GTP 3',8-cyclase MoaA [Dehalococcoidia bacterium]|nr:GTP 3',8-cyclase MoaA [Dehalococcoidia bacterium]
MNELVTDQMKRPIQDLRISVTDRCNLRCPYCMPAEIFGERYEFLNRQELLTFDEIERITAIFVKLGVTKVRLTGGEPLLRANLTDLITALANINGIDDLTLTTNGFLLAQNAQALKDAGLQRITVSLDSLDDATFAQMNGRQYTTARVLEGIAAAEKAGLSPIKINVVVQKGINEHTILDIARHFKGTGHIVRFIEYMDVGNLNGWDLSQVMPSQELISLINNEMPLEPDSPNYIGEVAKRYQYVDGTGEIGVISSVSNPFCGDCSRVRLSADGQMFTCLFASRGTDLRTLLRDASSEASLIEKVASVWRIRTDRYSEERSSLTKPLEEKVEMYKIGG